jgi:hypothetical protein
MGYKEDILFPSHMKLVFKSPIFKIIPKRNVDAVQDIPLHTVQTDSRAHPASSVRPEVSFPEGKETGHDSDHSPPSSAKVKND